MTPAAPFCIIAASTPTGASVAIVFSVAVAVAAVAVVVGRRHRPVLIVVAAATLLSVPLFYTAIMAEAGSTTVFLLAMGSAFALMYFYYSITYATIADITPRELRGTAMAVYFMAMYLLGGALGPYVVGAMSDHFTRTAALAGGVNELTAAALEPFRGAGLQSAMMIIPVLCIALAIIMFLAARARKQLD